MMPIPNPENKIKSLQDSLAAAKERQRRYDTQSKIIMGGTPCIRPAHPACFHEAARHGFAGVCLGRYFP